MTNVMGLYKATVTDPQMKTAGKKHRDHCDYSKRAI